MAVKKATNTKNEKLLTQNTTAAKGTSNTSIGSRPYSSPNTTTNAAKLTSSAPTTAAKSSTTTVGQRPYSSPNASTKNEGTTTANKGTGYTSLPYTTPNASAYNQAYSAPASTPSTPVLSLASGLSNLTNNAAPYASALGLASGATNATPTVDASNITPSSESSSSTPGLFDSIMRANAIAGSSATQPISNILGNTDAAHIAATRPYSNPNYEYDEEKYGSESNNLLGSHHGGGGGHAFFGGEDIEKAAPLGKGSLGNYIAANESLLDTLSSEGIPGYDVPYSTPNAGSVSYTGDTTKSGDTNYYLGGGTRSGGSSGLGGYDAGGIDVSALYDLLNQRLGEYEGNYTSLLDLLANNYGDLLNALGLNYSDTEALLNGQFTNSKNELEAARRRALQEAYINRMMQEKNLADQLDAYGLTGGASESVMANMRNNYANNRYQVEENLQNNLRELLQTYLTNLAGARDRYNNSLMTAQNNRFNALADAAQTRANARSNAYEDLYNTLANLTMKGIRYGG